MDPELSEGKARPRRNRGVNANENAGKMLEKRGKNRSQDSRRKKEIFAMKSPVTRYRYQEKMSMP